MDKNKYTGPRQFEMTLVPAMAAMWTAVFILSSASVTGVSGQYVSKLRDCPSYVAEKTSRDACVCYYDGPQNLVASIYTQWTGQDSVRSTSSTLRLESVTRGDDGKQYTCRVTGIPGQTVAPSVFTLHVAYGPSEGNVNISQSRVDPTASNSGVTRFHLTCSASDVSPPPRFSWTGLTCANNNHHTCVFTPDPAIPDPRNATCTVSPSVTGLGIAPVSNTIPLDLTYPPSGQPIIQSQPPASAQPLKAGVALTCTVSGGQPLVQSVLFTCTNPQLNDGPDQTNDTARSVSSSVTVTSSNSMERDMMCVCNATWGTGDGAVNLIYATSNYTVEHRANITSLTLDGVENTLTVNLTSSTPLSVEVRCQVYGRPAPSNASLTQLDGDLNRNSSLTPTDPDQFSHEAKITLPNVTCRDFGSYRCTAGNGVGPVASSTVLLDGNCPPQPLSSTIHNITTEGITFDLEAHPVPETFVLTYLGRNATSEAGTVSGFGEEGEMTSDSVIVKCEGGVGGRKWRVRCTVKAQEQARSGFYKLELGNGQGRVLIYFIYLKTDDATGKYDSISWYWYAVCGTSGGVVIVGVIAVPVVRKRRSSKRPAGIDNGPERDHAPGLTPRGSDNVAFQQDEPPPRSAGNIYELDDDPPTGLGGGWSPMPTAAGSDSVVIPHKKAVVGAACRVVPDKPGEDVYAVVNKKKPGLPKQDEPEGLYSNVHDDHEDPGYRAGAPAPSSGSQPDRAGSTNADGLFYTTLVFSEEQRRKAAEPVPVRETTDYATIDFTKKAPICSP